MKDSGGTPCPPGPMPVIVDLPTDISLETRPRQWAANLLRFFRPWIENASFIRGFYRCGEVSRVKPPVDRAIHRALV